MSRIYRAKPIPTLEEVLGVSGSVADPFYGNSSFFGIKGTWERLMLLLAFNRACGLVGIDHQNEGEAELRQQFESALGRDLTVMEWEAICARANSHASTLKLP